MPQTADGRRHVGMALAGRAAPLAQAMPRVTWRCLAQIRGGCRACAATSGAQLQRREPGDLSGIGPSPWPDLPLEEIYGKTKALRIRQHVNPLRLEHQTPKEAPDWTAIYADAGLPLVIGCAGGRFALALAHSQTRHNFLGLDLRHQARSDWHMALQLIERANAWAAELGLCSRVAFLQANATISLQSLLQSYPGSLELCTIQFPDPHFKKRHKKRRIVQRELVEALAALMPAQGRVFLQSDVEEVTAAMRDEFEQFGGDHFALAPEHESQGAQSQQVPGISPAATASRPAAEEGAGIVGSDAAGYGSEAAELLGLQWWKAGYLRDNPLGVPTEREVQTLKCGDPVFRVLLVRR